MKHLCTRDKVGTRGSPNSLKLSLDLNPRRLFRWILVRANRVLIKVELIFIIIKCP
jgi:hypothetical protein